MTTGNAISRIHHRHPTCDQLPQMSKTRRNRGEGTLRLLFRPLRCLCLWTAVNVVSGFATTTTVHPSQPSSHAPASLRKESSVATIPEHVPSSASMRGVQFAPFPTPHSGHFSLRMTTSNEDTVTSPARQVTETKVQVQRAYSTFYWRYKGKSYNINYRVSGPIDAPPLLLVHGFGANVNHFRFQFGNAELTGSHRVYALDLLGFGASDKPANADYSIELFAQLVSDFIKAMHGENPDQAPPAPWVLCGNSIGGLTCLCVAEQLPSLVRGVVLFNCAGGMTGFRYEDVPAWARPILYFVQNVVLGPFWGGRFFANFKTRDNVESILKTQGVYGDTRNVDEELLDILLGPSDDDGAEQVFLRVFAGPPGPTPESILPSIQCPVLAIWGGSDPWTPVNQGMHPGCNFGQYCDNFELHIIPGCGHCPHDEAPEKVHSIMMPWLKSTAAQYSPSQ